MLPLYFTSHYLNDIYLIAGLGPVDSNPMRPIAPEIIASTKLTTSETSEAFGNTAFLLVMQIKHPVISDRLDHLHFNLFYAFISKLRCHPLNPGQIPAAGLISIITFVVLETCHSAKNLFCRCSNIGDSSRFELVHNGAITAVF